jgi:chloramphenicol-sensitive protein RarD
MNRGVWYAIGGYLAWGFFPVYWKLLHVVPAPQLLAHRILWSFLSLLVIIVLLRQANIFRSALSDRRVLRVYALAAILIGINWLTYVWAVNAGFVVETSLGYFINPLLSVLLGVLFLRERLRLLQWIPIGLAVIGVAWLTITYGSLPWIALTLALSFGFYGLIKKTAPLGSLHGLTLETTLLLLPATLYLIYCESNGTGTFLHSGTAIDLLLVGAGAITTLPLLMFASAARRIPLSIVGILQYITPTIQFLLGVLVYHEALTFQRLVGFGFVWIALLVFAVESVVARRGASIPVVAEAE